MKALAPIPALRSTSSNSNEASRLKKSGSTGLTLKTKTPATSSSNSMSYSIKQTRLNTNSKSNKKENLQSSQSNLQSSHPNQQSSHSTLQSTYSRLNSSNSNNSLKAMNELASQNSVDSTKKTIARKPDPLPSEKKTTVTVKTLKQKAIGQSANQGLINSYKVRTKNTEEK